MKCDKNRWYGTAEQIICFGCAVFYVAEREKIW